MKKPLRDLNINNCHSKLYRIIVLEWSSGFYNYSS